MAKLVKENKVLIVDDALVDQYLAQGFDHVEEDGTLIQSATGGRSVTLEEHNELKKVIAELKAELKEKDDEIKVLEDENLRLDKALKEKK